MIENTDKFKGYLAYISICIVWGTTLLVIKIGVTDLPPMLFAGIRWVIAGAIFLIFMKIRGYSLPEWKEVKHLAVIGIFNLGIANGLVVTAEQWIPSGLTALVVTSQSFWLTGFDALIPGGRKLNFMTITGLLIGFAGIIIIFSNDIESVSNPKYYLGVGLVICGLIGWAVGSLYSKYKVLKVNIFMGVTVQMLIAGSAQLILGVILGEHNEFQLSGNGIFAIAYLILIGSTLGYGAYMYALKVLPVSFVSTYCYINPIIAIFLGWLILDEVITTEMIIAMIVILLGVFVVRKGSFDKKLET